MTRLSLIPSATITAGVHMTYVDGFLIPIPARNVSAYRRMASRAGRIWVEHGALAYRECVLDDPTVTLPDGSRSDAGMKARAGAKRGETVLFSYIEFRSKAHRDRVNRKVMQDARILATMEKAMPFDVTRMAYGGFRAMVDLPRV